MALMVRLTVRCDGCHKTAPITVRVGDLGLFTGELQGRLYPEGWSRYIDVDVCPKCDGMTVYDAVRGRGL